MRIVSRVWVSRQSLFLIQHTWQNCNNSSKQLFGICMLCCCNKLWSFFTVFWFRLTNRISGMSEMWNIRQKVIALFKQKKKLEQKLLFLKLFSFFGKFYPLNFIPTHKSEKKIAKLNFISATTHENIIFLFSFLFTSHSKKK